MRVITFGREVGSDIVINDPFVTRVHMQLVQDDSGAIKVVDMGSTNGTFVNGRRIEGECPLNPGDEVRIGHTILPWQQYLNRPAMNGAGQPNPILRQEQISYHSQPPKRPNNKAVYVILMLLLLLIVGVVVWFFVSKGSDKEAAPTDAPAATSDTMDPETSDEWDSDEWNSDEALRAYEEEWNQMMKENGPTYKRTQREQDSIDDLLQKEFSKILNDVIKLGKDKCNAFSKKMGWGENLNKSQFNEKAQNAFNQADERGKRRMIDSLKALRSSGATSDPKNPTSTAPKGNTPSGDQKKTDSKVTPNAGNAGNGSNASNAGNASNGNNASNASNGNNASNGSNNVTPNKK